MNTRLELTSEEATELDDLLEGAVSDLSMEIANTDSYDYRKKLKLRRDALAAVRRKLNAATEAAVET
jgi:hypothetical protein